MNDQSTNKFLLVLVVLFVGLPVAGLALVVGLVAVHAAFPELRRPPAPPRGAVVAADPMVWTREGGRWTAYSSKPDGVQHIEASVKVLNVKAIENYPKSAAVVVRCHGGVLDMQLRNAVRGEAGARVTLDAGFAPGEEKLHLDTTFADSSGVTLPRDLFEPLRTNDTLYLSTTNPDSYGLTFDVSGGAPLLAEIARVCPGE